MSVLLAMGTVALSIPAQGFAASVDTSEKVLSNLGITDSVLVGSNVEVTRGQFAQLLLNTSSFKGRREQLSTIAASAMLRRIIRMLRQSMLQPSRDG